MVTWELIHVSRQRVYDAICSAIFLFAEAYSVALVAFGNISMLTCDILELSIFTIAKIRARLRVYF